MAKITTGYSFGLNAKQAYAARMLASGVEEKEVLAVLFNIGPDTDEKERKKAVKTLHTWMRKQEFIECFRAIVQEVCFSAFGKAQQRLIAQIDNKNDWLANKAANDIITMCKPLIMGDEDKQIVVRVEGAPDIGAPGVDDE